MEPNEIKDEKVKPEEIEKTTLSKQEELKQPAKEVKVENPLPRMRQIIIETDGNNINLAKNEASHLELLSIFQILLNKITSHK